MRGACGMRGGGMRVGGGEQRVRAALSPPRVLTVLSVLSVAVCAQWRCAATPRPGWAERDCLGSAARARADIGARYNMPQRGRSPEWAGLGQVPSDKAAKRARKEAKKAKNAGKADVE